jgi:hypothetical protein
VVELELRADGPLYAERRVPDQIVDPAQAHDAGIVIDLLGARKIDQHGEPRLVGALGRQIGEVIQELVPARQTAQRVDPPEGVLQLDLRHDHRGEILERGDLGLDHGARLGSQDAQGAEPVPVAGHQRRAGIEAVPERPSTLSA